MANKKDPSSNTDDLQLFREAVADVRPLAKDKRVQSVMKKPSPRPRHSLSNESPGSNDLDILMSDPADIRDLEISDELFYARAGIQHKVQRKLRRGEFPVEAELDLHGYTVADAKIAINEFFAECEFEHKRCIRIIHGKGYRSEQKIPVLKTYVSYWLKQRADVMAYSSARPADGGTGALYVLLKVVHQHN